MNETRLADRVNALPSRYADRLDEPGLTDVASAAQAGEWGEAVDILLAGLTATRTPVTPAERDELLELLTAMGMPSGPVAQLNVQS